MSEYRLHYKRGKVGYAKNHAAYILREENYKGKEDLIYKESGNLPYFSGNNALNFWSAADEFEGVNRNAYRELELNIPNELNHKEAVNLIKDFVKQEIGVNFPYTFAIHESFNKKTGEKNLHCHLMFSERKLDGFKREKEKFFKKANTKNPCRGGAEKDREWKEKKKLLALRKNWEILQNKYLEKNGIDSRVDCRSLKDRYEEAIQNNDLKKAELFDRQPINISSIVLNKIKKNQMLTDVEIEEYNKYLALKEERKLKNREYAIRKGVVEPTKEELISLINKTEKIIDADRSELKRKAINIITKGEVFRTLKKIRDTEKELIGQPNDLNLNNKLIKLNKDLNVMLEEHVGTYRYIRLEKQLNRDYVSEKEMYVEMLKNKFNISYGKEKESKINQKKQDYKEKLKKSFKDRRSVENRILTLEKQDDTYLTMQLLSNFRLEGLAINSLMAQDNLKKIREDMQFDNNKQLNNSINELNSKINNYDKEYSYIKERISKEIQEKNKINNIFYGTLKYVNEKKLKEMDSLRELLKDLPKEDEAISVVKNLVEFEQLKKLSEYFRNKNDNEQYNKSLYKVNRRIEALENVVIEDLSCLKSNKNLTNYINEYTDKINTSEIKIKNLDKVVKGMSNLLDEKKLESKENYTKLELIALNKITKGEYSLNYKKKMSMVKEINEIEKEINSLGKLSFIKTKSLKNNLIEKQNILNIINNNEILLLRKYKGNVNLETEVHKIKNTYKKISSDFTKVITKEKREQNLNKQVLFKLKGISKQQKPMLAYEIKAIKTTGLKFEIKTLKNLRNIARELSKNSEIKNNLELTKGENEWDI